ncbi:P-loop containing nucleoside triphosphate hydrolase protein [Chiua virens]|nr:P-loop containing nucleoside triphosphate hydrolase protein [Chiua virens]
MNSPGFRNKVLAKNATPGRSCTTNTTSRWTWNSTMNATLNGHDSIPQDSTQVKIAVMGATGAGKSQFIHLLTNDDKIQIGHTLKSRTSNLQTARYTDVKTGYGVMLIDTPGFDNLEGEITDTDILEKIAAFLTPTPGEFQKLDGIIYMHRIGDASKVGRVSKNLKLFKKLCGDEILRHVCFVTTHWDEADNQACTSNEDNLKKAAFRIFLTAGVQMYRHTNTLESAQTIMSELIALPKISGRLPDQVVKGTPIEETDIGRIVKEIAEIKRQTEEAVHACEEALIAELDAKRKALEEKLSRAEEVQERLKMAVDELREQQETALAETATLRQDYEQAQEEARRLREQVELAEKQHEEDIAEQRKRRDEEHTATTRKEEVRQEEIARLMDAEQKVAELQRRMEKIDARRQNLKDYAEGLMGTMCTWHEMDASVFLASQRSSFVASSLNCRSFIGEGISWLYSLDVAQRRVRKISEIA